MDQVTWQKEKARTLLLWRQSDAASFNHVPECTRVVQQRCRAAAVGLTGCCTQLQYVAPQATLLCDAARCLRSRAAAARRGCGRAPAGTSRQLGRVCAGRHGVGQLGGLLGAPLGWCALPLSAPPDAWRRGVAQAGRTALSEFALDGDLTTYWSPTGGTVCCSESSPAWLVVSLGALREVGTLQIVRHYDLTCTVSLANASDGPWQTVGARV